MLKGQSSGQRHNSARLLFVLGFILLYGAVGVPRVSSIDETPIPLLDDEPRAFVVGLLALQGRDIDLDAWQPTFRSYLTATTGLQFSPALSFSVVVIKDLDNAVKTQQVDFLFVGPEDFSCLESNYNATPLVMLRNYHTIGANTYMTTHIGGVVFTKAERGDVKSIADTKGRSFAAASITSLVSGQAQFGLLREEGLSYLVDPTLAVFTGSEREVVSLVERGAVDVGFIRAGELERLEAEGAHSISLFRIIDAKNVIDSQRSLNFPFPFHVSTHVFPEWTLASLEHVPWMVQAHVQKALMSMAVNHSAAVRAHYEGWLPPLSFASLRRLQAGLGEEGGMERQSDTCGRSDAVYANVQCPEGFFKKSEEEVGEGCAQAGLECPAGAQCVCQPCQRGYEVDVFPSPNSQDLEIPLQSDKSPACARMSLCAITYQKTPFSLLIVDRLHRPSAAISVLVHSSHTAHARPTITPLAPFQYKAEIPIDAVGTHVIEISVNGAAISQSPLRVSVKERNCTADFGPGSMLTATEDGACVCQRGAVSVGGEPCQAIWMVVLTRVLPVVIALLLLVWLYVRRCRRRAQADWRVGPAEIKWSDPLEILGRGSCGLVLKAEYRGTTVAVKRTAPHWQRVASKRNSALSVSGQIMMPRNSDGYANTRNDSVSTIVSQETHLPVAAPEYGEAGLEGSRSAEACGRMVHSNRFDIVELDLPQMEEATELVRVLSEPEPRAANDAGHGSLGALVQGRRPSVLAWVRNKLGFAGEGATHADFLREMQVISRLRHPCITTVMGAVVQPGHESLLILEYMDHGSLYGLIHNDTVAVDGELIVPIIRDIAQGLRFLHAADPPLVHGDIKSQNILVEGSARFRAKVADFGFSHNTKSGQRGSKFFMPPEVLNGEAPSTAADVYAFAVLLCEVYGGRDPYEGEDPKLVLELIKDTTRDPPKRCAIPSECPPELSQLIKECWDKDKEMRPTFREIDRRLKSLSTEKLNPRGNSGSSSLLRESSMRRVSGVSGSVARTRSVAFAQMTNLLSDVFPKHIAEALTAGRKVEPERREMVTIFFSDIVGFTTISSEVEPEKVANMLDRLYTRLDALSREHCVFKVETIGDAYMAVTNLVESQPDDHAIRIARFSLAAVHAARETPVDTDDPERGCVNIRVGFHSGPVVANVVGTRNPRYCLFGDTVNTASRMESHSEAGKVHMSQAAARQVRKQDRALVIERRGVIDVKGKGMMKTYWLTRDKAAELDCSLNSSYAATTEHARSSSGEGLKRRMNKTNSMISRLASIEPERAASSDQAGCASRISSQQPASRAASASTPHEVAVLVHMRQGSVVDVPRPASGWEGEAIATSPHGGIVAASLTSVASRSRSPPGQAIVISGSSDLSETARYV